ncbi:undecaprenyl-diphosphate phosphatase [Alicyclobacillus herbarius]|uniref:undecaprenyl-diphosphate phosphatase n=1 Tax=Alicyclobacillus herbarius TaxID=122960 RepID=UPI000478D1AF|nr:undecaprenyl-diphosphate phosphatase [Alicyclobacillus herbarius]
MHWSQIIITALVQGITELFPISSVGHAVMLPYVAGWTDILDSEQFLPFVVILHLGTALALLIYFFRDWLDLIAAFFQAPNPKRRRTPRRRTFLLLVVATIPAAIVGKLFEQKFRELFPSALSAAIFLILNGIVLLLADRLKKNTGNLRISDMGYLQGFLIGCAQVFALIPGFSRSGVTMTAGLGLGLTYEESARFSFLLATPVILGAGILEVPKVLKTHATHILEYGVVGGILAGIVAYLSTAFLMKYFKTHEVRAFRPFAYYCIGMGIIVAVLSVTNIHF